MLLYVPIASFGLLQFCSNAPVPNIGTSAIWQYWIKLVFNEWGLRYRWTGTLKYSGDNRASDAASWFNVIPDMILKRYKWYKWPSYTSMNLGGNTLVCTMTLTCGYQLDISTMSLIWSLFHKCAHLFTKIFSSLSLRMMDLFQENFATFVAGFEVFVNMSMHQCRIWTKFWK